MANPTTEVPWQYEANAIVSGLSAAGWSKEDIDQRVRINETKDPRYYFEGRYLLTCQIVQASGQLCTCCVVSAEPGGDGAEDGYRVIAWRIRTMPTSARKKVRTNRRSRRASSQSSNGPTNKHSRSATCCACLWPAPWRNMAKPPSVVWSLLTPTTPEEGFSFQMFTRPVLSLPKLRDDPCFPVLLNR